MRPFLIALFAACLPLGAYAHHGRSSYDSSRTVTFAGSPGDERDFGKDASAVGGKTEEPVDTDG